MFSVTVEYQPPKAVFHLVVVLVYDDDDDDDDDDLFDTYAFILICG